MEENQRYSIDVFCKSLPKVELHAPLNESLSVNTLIELGCGETSIRKFLILRNKTPSTCEERFELFKTIYDATPTPEAMYIATKRVIDKFANENVIYLELRITPRSAENMTKEEHVESVVKAINDNDRDIIVKLILSINRNLGDTSSLIALEVILNMRKKYPSIIKGMNLISSTSVGRFERQLLKVAREDGLLTTVHLPWIKNDEEIKEILNFRPDRISDAIYLHPMFDGCEENWELYCEKRIPVEFSVTANIKSTSAALAVETHYIGEWIHSGQPFAICTSGTGVFSTTLTREYKIIAETYDLSAEDLWKVTLNAIDYSFASNAEKLHLKTKLAEFKRDSDFFFR